METLGFITPTTAGIILVVALVIFGPGKLPELGKGLGKGIKEFKSATNLEIDNNKEKEVKAEVEEKKEIQS